MQRYSKMPNYLTRLEKLLQHRSEPTCDQGHIPRTAERPNRARRLRPEEIDELVAAYVDGTTTKELGERFKIHKTTVGKHLRARGIDTTPPGLAPELVPEAVGLYEKQGWSTERIAVKFATSAGTIRSRLLEAGVKMRDTHGRKR